jgi:mannosyltransferase OCH1-like enzyme
MANQGITKDKKSNIIRKMLKWLIAMWFCTTFTFTTIYLLQTNYPYFYLLLNPNQISRITEEQITIDENHKYVRQIPRIIHQTYIDRASIPEKWKKMSKTCKKLHPHWQYRFYSDEDMYKFVRKYYPEQMENFQAYPHIIQRVDAFRYMLLHHYGGVYLDFDVGCKKSLEPFLIYPVALPEPEPIGISNDVLFSAKGHPFFERAISVLPAWNHNYLWLKYVTVMISTGPMFLSAQLSSYYYYLFSDDGYNNDGDYDNDDRNGDESTLLQNHHQLNNGLILNDLNEQFQVKNNNRFALLDDNYGIHDDYISTQSLSDEEEKLIQTQKMNDGNNNNDDDDDDDDDDQKILMTLHNRRNDFFFNEDDVDAIKYLHDDDNNGGDGNGDGDGDGENDNENDVDNEFDHDHHFEGYDRDDKEVEKRHIYYFDDGDYYRDHANNNKIVRKYRKREGVYVIDDAIYSPSSRSFFKHVRGKSWHGGDAYFIFVIQKYFFLIPYLIVSGFLCALLYIVIRRYYPTFSLRSISPASSRRFQKL